MNRKLIYLGGAVIFMCCGVFIVACGFKTPLSLPNATTIHRVQVT